MKIRCLAVDDEPYALKQIADYIRKTPFLEISGECGSAFEAMKEISEKPVDLLFMDISMPGMSGMEFARTLPQGILVIFTTAYEQYAVESYKVNAVDYLLKPIPYEDFLRAANKAWKLILKEKEDEGIRLVSDHIFVNAGGTIRKINLDEIDYIESSSEYVKICLGNRTQVMTLLRLKNLEAVLPKERFMRVHRSYIVNLQKITTIERNRIIYYGSQYIPVSDPYKADFRKFIESYFIEGS